MALIQGEGRDNLEKVFPYPCTESGRKVHISAYISGKDKKKSCNPLGLQLLVLQWCEGGSH